MRHAEPTRRGNRPGFRGITLATIVIVIAGGLGALGAYLLTEHRNAPQPRPAAAPNQGRHGLTRMALGVQSRGAAAGRGWGALRCSVSR